MQRPSPDQYNPPLTWRAQLWRFTAAVAFSGVLWWFSAPAQWEDARWLFWLDLSFGLVSLGLTFYRRRWPFAVAVLTSVLGCVSVTANGPGTLATVSLATRRVIRQILVMLLLMTVSSISIPLIQPRSEGFTSGIDIVLGMLFAIAMLAIGMYIGSRRELLWTLRDRAQRAEDDQALRVEQGRLNERHRIAREMHDVLAHRISLIAMHAGAMAYRKDLTAEEMHETAALIQAKSHEALTDLRQVLGVLRDDEHRRAERASAADVRRPGRARAGGRGSRHAHPVRRPGGWLVADAGAGRPHGVPDRPGGADQRAQARAGSDRPRGADRLAGRGSDHPDPEPRAHSAARRAARALPVPDSAWSAWASAPSWPVASCPRGSTAARSS